MATWRPAHSLNTLRAEVKARWPGTVVGTIGDQAHAARRSDHNPDDHDDNPDTPAIVSAADIMGRAQATAVWDHIRSTRDPRVEYVIHNRQITGSDKGWRVDTYYGSNPHTDHCHVSVGRGSDGDVTRPDLYDDPSPWGIADIGTPDPGDPIMSSAIVLLDTPFDSKETPAGWLLQALVNEAGVKLERDGRPGPDTRAGVEAAIGRQLTHRDKLGASDLADLIVAVIDRRIAVKGGGSGGGVSEARVRQLIDAGIAGHRHDEGRTGPGLS